LQEAGSVSPWSPSVWAEIGATQLELDQVDEAFNSFVKGYEIRPGKTNPCLWGVVETARKLGKIHILARLIERHVISSELVGVSGRIDVAVELWRGRDPRAAMEVIDPTESGTLREREIAGWLAQDMGEDSLAIRILEPIVAAGESSGETIYRLAAAYDRQGSTAKRKRDLTTWGERFPNHLGLATLRNVPVPEQCEDHIDDDGLHLGNTVRLLGWDTLPKPARTGETLTVYTCWAATKPLRDMVMILHFDVGSPPTWRLNKDHAPVGGILPTSDWPVGELVVDKAEILIPDDAPVGEYRVFTGLWEPGEEASRLRPEGAYADLIPRGEKRIPLGTIEVVGEGGSGRLVQE
jgi:hypothetical protein